MSCINPNVSYYFMFNLLTCVPVGFLVLVASIFFVVRRMTRRRDGASGVPVSDEEAEATKSWEQRMHRFRTRCQKGAVLLVYVLYCPVSQKVISVFACRQIGSSYFLYDDYRVQCYTPQHLRYVALGTFWLFVFVIGVPLGFGLLLIHYRVPTLAREKTNDAWLRSASQHAWRMGLPQPEGYELSRLSTLNISDEHLDVLLLGLAENFNAAVDEEVLAMYAGAAGSRHVQRRMSATLRSPDSSFEEMIQWLTAAANVRKSSHGWLKRTSEASGPATDEVMPSNGMRLGNISSAALEVAVPGPPARRKVSVLSFDDTLSPSSATNRDPAEAAQRLMSRFEALVLAGAAGSAETAAAASALTVAGMAGAEEDLRSLLDALQQGDFEAAEELCTALATCFRALAGVRMLASALPARKYAAVATQLPQPAPPLLPPSGEPATKELPLAAGLRPPPLPPAKQSETLQSSASLPSADDVMFGSTLPPPQLPRQRPDTAFGEPEDVCSMPSRPQASGSIDVNSLPGMFSPEAGGLDGFESLPLGLPGQNSPDSDFGNVRPSGTFNSGLWSEHSESDSQSLRPASAEPSRPITADESNGQGRSAGSGSLAPGRSSGPVTEATTAGPSLQQPSRSSLSRHASGRSDAAHGGEASERPLTRVRSNVHGLTRQASRQHMINRTTRVKPRVRVRIQSWLERHGLFPSFLQPRLPQGRRSIVRLLLGWRPWRRTLTFAHSDRVDNRAQKADEDEAAEMERKAAKRKYKVDVLIAWAKQCPELSIAESFWMTPDEALLEEEDEEEDEEEAWFRQSTASAPALAPLAAAVPASRLLRERQDMERRAVREVGFLFLPYEPGRWWWEQVELSKKIVLTAGISFVARGSAQQARARLLRGLRHPAAGRGTRSAPSQVVVALVIAFFLVLLFERMHPYADPRTTNLGKVAQITMFFYLLVALLLKMQVVLPPDTYDVLVETLSLLTPVAPVLMGIIFFFM